jgi:hypothetical protein
MDLSDVRVRSSLSLCSYSCDRQIVLPSVALPVCRSDNHTTTTRSPFEQRPLSQRPSRSVVLLSARSQHGVSESERYDSAAGFAGMGRLRVTPVAVDTTGIGDASGIGEAMR